MGLKSTLLKWATLYTVIQVVGTSAILAEESPSRYSFSGQTRAAVENKLQELDVDYELNYVKACLEKDIVASTNPPIVERLSGRWPRLVIVNVSERQGRVIVPPLKSADVSTATTILTQLGLNVNQTAIVPPKPAGDCLYWRPSGETGRVVADVNPTEGSRQCLGEQVTLVVYSGGRWLRRNTPRRSRYADYDPPC